MKTSTLKKTKKKKEKKGKVKKKERKRGVLRVCAASWDKSGQEPRRPPAELRDKPLALGRDPAPTSSQPAVPAERRRHRVGSEADPRARQPGARPEPCGREAMRGGTSAGSPAASRSGPKRRRAKASPVRCRVTMFRGEKNVPTGTGGRSRSPLQRNAAPGTDTSSPNEQRPTKPFPSPAPASFLSRNFAARSSQRGYRGAPRVAARNGGGESGAPRGRDARVGGAGACRGAMGRARRLARRCPGPLSWAATYQSPERELRSQTTFCPPPQRGDPRLRGAPRSSPPTGLGAPCAVPRAGAGIGAGSRGRLSGAAARPSRRRARGEGDTYWQAAAGEPPARRGETPGDTAVRPPALPPAARHTLPSSAAFMVLPSRRAPCCGAAGGLSLPVAAGSRDGGAAAAAGGAALGIHPAGRRSPGAASGPPPAPRRPPAPAPPARLHAPGAGAAPPPTREPQPRRHGSSPPPPPRGRGMEGRAVCVGTGGALPAPRRRDGAAGAARLPGAAGGDGASGRAERGSLALTQGCAPGAAFLKLENTPHLPSPPGPSPRPGIVMSAGPRPRRRRAASGRRAPAGTDGPGGPPSPARCHRSRVPGALPGERARRGRGSGEREPGREGAGGEKKKKGGPAC